MSNEPAVAPATRLTVANVATARQRMAVRVLALFGWHVEFDGLPGPHGVIIVYPHTSNWDFPLGLLGKWAIGCPFHWLAKESLFTGPIGRIIGPLLRSWGGEPVARSSSTGATQRLALRMRAAPWYWLALAPEGTRALRPRWRSGFYHLALQAQVPLLAVSFDYATRTVAATAVVNLCGEVEADRAAIAHAFAARVGYRPANAAPITWT